MILIAHDWLYAEQYSAGQLVINRIIIEEDAENLSYRAYVKGGDMEQFRDTISEAEDAAHELFEELSGGKNGGNGWELA